MDKSLLRFELENGIDLYIEGDHFNTNGITKTSNAGVDRIINSDFSFETLIAKIKPVSSLIMESLTDINNPNDVELSFGIKFGGKAGVVFASVDSEATFNIKLKWSNPK